VPVFKLVLEYDGTDFEGWQAQPAGHRTVQGELETALARIAGAPVAATGAGRTDAGVHAEGQVASVPWPRAFDPETLARAANAHLPRDLAVRAAAVAPEGFHARRDATGKHYRYAIWNGPHRSPLRTRRFHFESTPLDLPAMAAAARRLEGEHDFASFQAAGSSVVGTVRRLRRVAVEGRAGGEVLLQVEGDGFLRHMVRNLAGTLLEVGTGRRHPDSLGEVLAARRRDAAGPTAPARGLTLVRVEYRKPRDPGGFPAPAG
jgi:tRNA pseudouridine38-40 synthase